MAGLKKVQLEELLDHFLRRFYRWPGSEKLSKEELLRVARQAVETGGRYGDPVVLWVDGDIRGRIKKRKSLFPTGPIGNMDFDSLEAHAYRGKYIRILYAPKDILEALCGGNEYYRALSLFYKKELLELGFTDRVEISFDRVAVLSERVVDGVVLGRDFCLEFANAANSCSWLRHEAWSVILHQLLMIEQFCKNNGIDRAGVDCWEKAVERNIIDFAG